MNRFVLDASVVVKWVIAEPLHEQARNYRSKHITLLSPTLLLTECASAIQKKVWRGEINDVDGWQFYEILSSYERVVYTPDNLLIPHAYQIAIQLTHPVYDCLYLALAERENARMVTADRKLYNRVMMSHFSHLIAWVEDPPEISDT